MSDLFKQRPMRFMDGDWEGCRQIVDSAFQEGHTINIPGDHPPYIVTWNGHDMRWEAWTRQSADVKISYATSEEVSEAVDRIIATDGKILSKLASDPG